MQTADCSEGVYRYTLPVDKRNGTVIGGTPGGTMSGDTPGCTTVISGTPGCTTLISVMAANNEFPVRNDLSSIKKVLPPGSIFHTDATQLFGKVARGYPWVADLISFSTHKFNGLKGVGVLIYRKNVLEKHGGTLKRLVGGTSNSTAILAHAPLFRDLAEGKMDGQDDHYLDLRIHLFESLKSEGVRYKSLEPKDPSYLNFGTCLLSFPGACNLLIKKHLDQEGVVVSIGSACDTNKKGARAVLRD
jgi:cysteine desulfurase